VKTRERATQCHPVRVNRVPCAAAAVLDASGRILLIRRGKPPGVGLWSLPGGRIEAGESAAAAAIREVREETALDIELLRLLGVVDLPAAEPDCIYVASDFLARVRAGSPTRPQAGSDVTDARWVTRAQLAVLPTTVDLVDTLTLWRVWGY